MKNHLYVIPVALCLTLIAGCYEKSTQNLGLVLCYPIWAPTLVVAGGIAIFLVGLRFSLREKRLWKLMIGLIGPIVAAAIAPGMYMNGVIMGQESIYSRHGWWWQPRVWEVRYAGMTKAWIRLNMGERHPNLNNYYVDCFYEPGVLPNGVEIQRIPIEDEMLEFLPDVVEQFKKHVPVDVGSLDADERRALDIKN